MVVIVFWCSHVDTPTGFAHPLGSTRPLTYTSHRGRSGVKFPHICTPGRFFIRVAVLCIRAAVICFRRCTFLHDCELTFDDSYTLARPQTLPTCCTRRLYTTKGFRLRVCAYDSHRLCHTVTCPQASISVLNVDTPTKFTRPLVLHAGLRHFIHMAFYSG